MDWPAEMVPTGDSEGQGSMCECCNLDIPAGYLAYDRVLLNLFYFVINRTL